MTLTSRPAQTLLAVVIAVVLGPPLGAAAVFLGGFGMYAADNYPWDLSPGSLLAAGKMLLALIVVGYIFAAKIALAAGILVGFWILWRPPNLAVAFAAAGIASIGYCLLAHGKDAFHKDNLVTVAASLVSAAGCWFLTRRFARVA